MAKREELVLEIKAELDRATSDVKKFERQLKELEDTELQIMLDVDPATADVDKLATAVKAVQTIAEQKIQLGLDIAAAKADADALEASVNALVDKGGQRIPIGVDLGSAVADVQALGSGLDNTASKADQAADALRSIAATADAELRGAAAAADALAASLGPELSATANFDKIITGLQEMGFTFDEIIADADKLGAALKDVDQINMKQATDGLDTHRIQTDRARTATEKLGNSSDQTRSVLANMAGNASQDMGELAGISGTAGVAIGQLAEYATEGNISLKALAKTAGPLAAVGSVLYGLMNTIKFIRQPANQAAEAVEDMTAVMKLAGDESANLRDHFEEIGVVLSETGDRSWFDVLKEGLLGIGDGAEDMSEELDLAGLTFADFAAAVTEGSDAADYFHDRILEAALAEDLTEDQWRNLTAAMSEQTTAWETAAAEQERTNRLNAESAESLYDLALAVDQVNNPLEYNQGLWEIIIDDLANAGGFTEVTAQAFNLLASEMKLTSEQILAIAQAELDKRLKSYAELADDVTEAFEGAADRIAEFGKEARRLATIKGIEDVFEGMTEYSEDTAEHLADAYDAVEEMRASDIEDVFEGMSKYAEDTAEHLADAYEAVEELHSSNIEDVFEGLEKYSEDTAEFLADAYEAVEKLHEVNISNVVDSITEVQERIGDLDDELAEVVSGFNDAELSAEAMASAFDKLDDASDFEPYARYVGLEDGLITLDGAIRDLVNSGTDLHEVDLIPENWTEVQDMPEQLRPVVDAFSAMREAVQEQLAEGMADDGPAGVVRAAQEIRDHVIEEFEQMRDDGIITTEQMTAGIEQTFDALGVSDEDIVITIRLQGEEQARAILGEMGGVIEDLPAETQLEIIAMASTDPIAALQFAIDALEAAGITVPAALQLQVDTLQEQADRAGNVEVGVTPIAAQRLDSGFFTGSSTVPVPVPVEPTPPATEIGSGFFTGGARSVEVPVTPVLAADLGSGFFTGSAMTASGPTITPVLEAAIVAAALDALVAPRDAPVTAVPDVEEATAALDTVAEERDAPVTAVPDTAAADTALDDVAEDRTARIVAQANTTDAALRLMSVARDRTAWVEAFASTISAENRLNEVARDRTARIYVQTIGSAGLPSGSGPGPGGVPASSRAGPLTGRGPVGAAAPMGAPVGSSSSSVAVLERSDVTNVTNQITLNAAVIGNRFDVQRAVAKAVRGNKRLNGSRR